MTTFELMGWLIAIAAVFTMLTGVVIFIGIMIYEFLNWLFTVEINGKRY